MGAEVEGEGQNKPALCSLGEWQQAILESANCAIIATNVDGLIVSFNPAAERLLGYRAEEMVGIQTPAVLHDAEEVRARALSLSLELGQPVAPGFEVFVAKARQGVREEREWTYVRQDGSRFPVLLSISALYDQQGCLSGFLGMGVDLTLRKQWEASQLALQAHALSHDIIGAIAEGILCLEPEPPYCLRFINPFAAGLLRVDPAEVIGQPLESVFSIQADTIKGPDGVLERLKPRDATAFEAEVFTPTRLEGFSAALTIARTSGPDGDIVVLTMQDVTQRRQNEQEMRLSGKVFEVCSEAIMITDVAGRILGVNPAFTWLTGYRPDEVVGRTPRLLKSGRHDDAFYADMWQKLLVDGFWAGELWDRRKDGSLYPKWATINAVRERGEITHFVALAHDISAHKEHEQRIQHLAEHDALTGLPNRRLLTARAAQMIASERRADQQFAVLLLDLDRFKNINDTLGHQVGDQVLIEVARRLTQGVRSSDTVVRLGGDEFVVLLSDIAQSADLVEVVAGLHRRLAEPIMVDGRALHAPPSMGIACYPADGSEIDLLLRNADTAMYQTKERGRNGWTFYTAEMNRHIAERLALEEGLRVALRDGAGLQLHFQPLLDARTQAIVSWEALLRWQHPELGAVPPDRLIPIAEESGLIHALGHWVIQAACREVRHWQNLGIGAFRVSVNVSPTQLEAAGLEAVVAAALEENDLTPDRLELEITESVLMSHSPVAMRTLESLRRRGVLLTLDDFGTGYSSLTYLKTLSVDRVKIDRSFVRNVTEDKSDASIVQAVLMLANNLELAVVAEGVETAAQHDFLRAHGCSEVQGFLLGQPMPGEAIAAYLAQQSGVVGTP